MKYNRLSTKFILFFLNRCMFQIVKPGRGMAFSLNPSDLQNSQKNTSQYGKKELKKAPSIEDDIEDFARQSKKTDNVKWLQSTIINSKDQKNKLETENIDEDEEQEIQHKKNISKQPITTNSALLKKSENSQKQFVKSKGQLKNNKGVSKNSDNAEQQIFFLNKFLKNNHLKQRQENNSKKSDHADLSEKKNNKQSNKSEEDDDFELSFPKTQIKYITPDKNGISKKRLTKKNMLETEQESIEPKQNDGMKLDSSFLKRIQEKLNNNQKNDSRAYINELAIRYSSQKINSQKQSQDIPFDNQLEIQKQDSEENDELPNNIKKSNKIDSSLDSEKSDKQLKNNKQQKNIQVNKEESKSNKKQNAQKEELLNQENDLKQKVLKAEETSNSKKSKKNFDKKEEKNKKIEQQIEIETKNEQPQRNSLKNSDKKVKNGIDKKILNKILNSQSNSTVDRSDDEDYSIEEEEEHNYIQSQNMARITRKRKVDEAMNNKLNEEVVKSDKTNEKQSKQDTPQKKLTKTEIQKEQEQMLSEEKESNKKVTQKLKLNQKQQKDEIKLLQTPKKETQNEKILSKLSGTKMDIEKDQNEQKNQKNIKSDSKNKDKMSVSKLNEQKLISTTTTKSTRKSEQDKNEEEKKMKQTPNKSNSINLSAKKSTQKSVQKETKDDQTDKMETEEITKTRKSVRKQLAKDEDTIKPDEKSTKQKNNNDSKSKKVDKTRNHIRRTGASKKELKQLQQTVGNFLEIPKRNKYRILFSNSKTTEKEKKIMENLGAKILNEFNNPNDFNILVTDDFKRRLKTLVALNKGYPIVSSSWIQQCVKSNSIDSYDHFIIKKVDSALAKQHSFDLKKSLENQKNNEKGILSNLSFVCQNSFDNINQEDLRKLVESAGGTFLYDKIKQGGAYYLSDASQKDYNQQLNEENCIILDIEGLLQTCLLQNNVLDNYIIVAKDKKSASKKK